MVAFHKQKQSLVKSDALRYDLDMNSKVLIQTSLILVGLSLQNARAQTQIETIAVSDAVAANQVGRLQSDFDYLKTLSILTPDPELLKLMQITDASPDTLLNWMEARVHYLVDENIDVKARIGGLQMNYPYENPGILPTLETPTKTPGNAFFDTFIASTPVAKAPEIFTVMTNIGFGLYYGGKLNQVLLSLNISGVGTIHLTSPRVGIVKVGKGLFAQMFEDSSIQPDAKPYIAMRLGTLFHEARHSDGNGKTLGFSHATCASGDFTGYAACDRNLNGPYQIQAKFVKTLITNCPNCTLGDTHSMQTLVADAASRQILVTPPERSSLNSMVIQALQSQIETCRLFVKLNVHPTGLNCDLQSLQKQMNDLNTSNQNAVGTPSTWWDATPEGI